MSLLLILSPSLVSDADAVKQITSEASALSSDVHQQVLDRITAGLINLPGNYFSRIVVASSKDHVVDLDSTVLATLFAALKEGGTVEGSVNTDNKLPWLLAGYLYEDNHYKKPASKASAPVSLNRQANGSSNGVHKFKKAEISSKKLTADDVKMDDEDDEDDEDDYIDENNLIDLSLQEAIKIPARCEPGNGRRRRRACKDCTCGLKEQEEKEAEDQRAKQDDVLILNQDDVAEVDFTVPGKTGGSCGSCALGDAFRCDGCPYLGLPPFKPGEQIQIGGDDDL